MHVRTTQDTTLNEADMAPRRPAGDPAAGLAASLAGLAAVALAPLALATLRLFEPMRFVADAAWLAPLAAGIAALAAGLALVATVTAALRDGSPRLLAHAVAMGALGSGLAVAGIRAATMPTGFPDPSLSVGAAAAGALLVIGRLLPAAVGWHRAQAVGAAIAAFAAIEAVLAGGLLAAPPPQLATWLLVAAATVAAISAVPGPWLPAGLLAAGMAVLAVARTGSLDAVPGMVALAAGCGSYAAGALRAGWLQPPADDLSHQPAAPPPALPPEPILGTSDDEAMRLARELRGTIAELLQARRTVELQRDEIGRLTTIDPLTGVPSRRAILDRMRSEAAQARRYGHSVALLLLDLDAFGEVNRIHGMDVGDEVLREVALRLRLRVRAADALGRVGADSFLALLPHTDETGAATFADALRSRLLARPIGTTAGEISVGLSIGVAFMRPGMPLSDDELLAEAHAALASARAAGGNRIAFDRLHGLVRLEDRRRPATETDRPVGGEGTR